MKRFTRSVLGVTLLEIMLVLAIAAMIIVMSVRYYQSATISNQVNMAMGEIQAITAGMDNLAIGSGSYVTNYTSLGSAIGSNNMISPTNGTNTVTSTIPTTYVVTMPLNDAICVSVKTKLAASIKMTVPACSGGTLTYTYDNTK